LYKKFKINNTCIYISIAGDTIIIEIICSIMWREYRSRTWL